MSIVWKEEQIPLKDLKEYQRNPRRINKDQFSKLVNSIKEDGYHQRLLVNADGTIIGGHQRKRALKEAGYKPTDNIKVLMPDRLLDIEDFKRINVRDNIPFGEYDFDMLSCDFENEELIEWGLPDFLFPKENSAPHKENNEQLPKSLEKCPNCGFEYD